MFSNFIGLLDQNSTDSALCFFPTGPQHTNLNDLRSIGCSVQEKWLFILSEEGDCAPSAMLIKVNRILDNLIGPQNLETFRNFSACK